MVPDVNGLAMHILEAGFETPGRTALLLLHGFPELAYSWRKVMGPLAAAGYHVIAPDMRGYGRTTGWDEGFDVDLAPFGYVNLVRDCVALVQALGYGKVACVVGHDFGSPVAAHCGLIRPDVFKRVVLMSAPYEGPPQPEAAGSAGLGAGLAELATALAALDPPRKHYQLYYATRPADADMREAPEGIAAFLRAYYHVKSADWPGNTPHPLPGWSAKALAQLPDYYVMPLDRTMAEVCAAHRPDAACSWLTDDELAVYADAFSRTGFQGGLNWYRHAVAGGNAADVRAFAGAPFDVPCLFIAGASDWGIYQSPGVFERMQEACKGFAGAHLVSGAGHWVQQEQPQAAVKAVLDFL